MGIPRIVFAGVVGGLASSVYTLSHYKNLAQKTNSLLLEEQATTTELRRALKEVRAQHQAQPAAQHTSSDVLVAGTMLAGLGMLMTVAFIGQQPLD
jgi:hypothetical protein